ncbi:MAG: CarD family transcriptional regulator [Acidobacteria bacterium]|nr:CarD family transcriptional regulator [Acidobacteriota bacterium]
MAFKVGDKVVYPNHGIGVIEDIAMRAENGGDSAFYCLRIYSNKSTVMVPTANTDQVGLRKVVSKKQLDRVFRILRSSDMTVASDWKGRYQENSDRMRTGSIEEVAQVLKNLALLSQSKSLSYRERKMLDKARYLVVSEIAEVSRQSEQKVEEKIDRAIGVTLRSQAEH